MIQDSVARHLERHRLRRRHAAAIAPLGDRCGVSREAEARRICDGVVRRSLDVFGHSSCAVEGAQVCFARDYEAQQERRWHRVLLQSCVRDVFLAQLRFTAKVCTNQQVAQSSAGFDG